MPYLNFAVEVAALPNDQYRISVQSPVGEASADAASPFTPQEIANYLAVLGGETKVSREERLRVAREFGGRLFNFLLGSSTTISNAYFASLREAANAEGLRLRLTVDQAGVLSQLPWEYLRDPSNDFLALSRRTPIVRYTPQLDVRPPATISLPLRVLVMISAPQGLPELDVEGEWQRLQAATAPLQARGLIALERLDTATLIALQHRLRAEEYHIFHYIGHSDYDAQTQQGVIVFENEQDNTRPQLITAAELSRELAEESTVRLVVLNSCQSARRPNTDAFAGISSAIVTRGIPAVVAMQFAISDGAATAFADEFYRALAELLPLDAAVSEARRAIANRLRNNEWATPVLYLRADSGVLFRIADGATATPTRPSQPPVQPGLIRRVSNGQLILLGGAAILVLALLFFGLTRFVFPPLPTPTPTTALLPDLEVGTIRVSPPNPAPGEIFILSITINNVGQADSGPFNWTWDASVANPELRNAQDGHVENIPAGTSKNVSFPFSYGWWQTYTSQVNVDADTQVEESDNRNNSRSFQIETARKPFEIDFTLLPLNHLAEPPVAIDASSFAPWNLTFEPDTTSQPDCADTGLQLVQRGRLIALSSSDDDPTCANLPLIIRILRAPVGAADVQILPVAAGTASLTYYADLDGTQPLLQTAPITLTAGNAVTLSAGDDTLRSIQRIDVSALGQAVQITHVTLTPRP